VEDFGFRSEIWQRFTNALDYTGRAKSTFLLEEPETLDSELLHEEEDEAKSEAQKDRRGLTMFTDW